jgi:hypothetical protein
MAITIKCPKCGLENQLGRIFCHHCGSKLEFSEGSFQTAKPTVTRRQLAMRLVRLGIVLGLLAAIVLMLLPVNPAGQTGSRQDSVIMDQKIRVLRRAVLDGRTIREVARETEVNAYLEEARGRSGQNVAMGPAKLDLSKINVALTQGRVNLVMHTTVGPLTVSFQVEGIPGRDQGRFSFDADGGRIGHLPLPGAAAGWLAGRLSFVFSKMDRERKLLDDVKQIDVTDGQAIIQTGR